MITIMLGEIVHFGAVMGVIMMGFAVAFKTLLHASTLTFGEVWLGVFKAMLGEVGVFETESGDAAYGDAVTALLVIYLVIMAVMLLNLLIAVLSTEHAKVDERSDREFSVSKVRVIKLYRRVVDQEVLPAPFNLVQLALALPFAVVDLLFQLRTHAVVRLNVGVAIFWLGTGPFVILLAWMLWVVSVPQAVVGAWKGTNYTGTSYAFRVLGCGAVLLCHVFVVPALLLGFWIQSAIAGIVAFVKAMCSSRCCDRQATVAAPGESAPHRKRVNVSVAEMLRNAPEGLNVREIWAYLEDPNTPTSPAMRQDESSRPSTVEHVRLLRNHLEQTYEDRMAELLAHLKSADALMAARVKDLEQRFDGRVQKLERSISGLDKNLEMCVAGAVEHKVNKLEEKLDALLRKL